MGDKDETHNDTPDLRDALRSIDAIGEDQRGLDDSPGDEDKRPRKTDESVD